MSALKNISSVYFLGIGGIGMSALARYFNHLGIKVSGYDKTPTFLTKQLENEGIAIHYVDDVNQIDKNASIVVYTPAVPAQHTELNYYKDNQFKVLKRSDVLGIITENSFNICVAGTHGKTTTSAMIAHILKNSSKGCTAFLGGIATNYGTNFWTSDSNIAVVEADEYDRSFLKLNPDVAIITAMDADHLDIYGTEENMQDAFVDFTKRIKSNGVLIYKNNIGRIDDFVASKKLPYALKDIGAAVHAEDICIENGAYVFNAIIAGEKIDDVELHMGGWHNMENALAAIAATNAVGVSNEEIKTALASFKGVKRRFESILKSEKSIFIDDYAHHPEELRALIQGAKELFPGRKTTLVFQPHLYSRTKDHATAFAEILSLADETILLPIYPARELPMEGVNSEMIEQQMSNKFHKVMEKDALLNWLKENNTELLITAGAGDIDAMLEIIKNILISKN